MHSLFFATRVDGYGSRVNHHHNTGHHLVLLKQGSNNDRDNVQGVLVFPLKLRNHHQQFVVSKHSTSEEGRKRAL